MHTLSSVLTDIKQGDYTLGKPYFVGHSWRRSDLFALTSKYDTLTVTDSQDFSPIWRHWIYGNFNASCTCCYLGLPHSEQYHNKEATP